jgi:hypothetical protein
MVDRKISRVRLHDLARLGRSRTEEGDLFRSAI